MHTSPLEYFRFCKIFGKLQEVLLNHLLGFSDLVGDFSSRSTEAEAELLCGSHLLIIHELGANREHASNFY